MNSPLSLALAGIVFASASHAFEVTGGSVSLGYSSFVGGNDASDVNKLSLGSSMEFGLTRQFSAQADFAVTNFGLTNAENVNFGLHGIGHLNDSTSLGAFIGRDRISSVNLDYFGFEIGHQMGAFGTEAFVSFAEESGVDGTVLGIKGDYALSDAATVGANFTTIDVLGFDASRLSVTGEVAATPGLTLSGEVGRARIDSVGSETFVGVGVKVNFGAKRGATFDRRSIVDLLPGL